MRASGEALRALAEQAYSLAARELTHGRLYSVLVDLGEGAWVPMPRYVHFGFHELKRGVLFGTRLKACWVELCTEPRSLRIMSTGTYGRRQFKELAAIRGIGFPPPTLDLSRLRLEIPEIVAVVQRSSPLGAATGTLNLSVCVHDGHLAWRALHEVREVGLRTLIVDAGDGQVLYDKVDWWDKGVASRSPFG